MKSVWFNGWGRSAEGAANTIRRFLPGEHLIIQPFEGWQREVERQLDSETTLYGYSLGAFLLLGSPELARRARRSILLAPFLDLKAESKRGGTVPTQDIKGLRRLLLHNTGHAVRHFSKQARLSPDPMAANLPRTGLLWGLDQLLGQSRPESAAQAFLCWVGEKDALSDHSVDSPMSRIATRLKGATHSLESLLEALHAL